MDYRFHGGNGVMPLRRYFHFLALLRAESKQAESSNLWLILQPMHKRWRLLAGVHVWDPVPPNRSRL
jgi:hypothetical protein